MTDQEFKILYKKYHKALNYFAKSIIGEIFCEDVTADSFMKLYEIRDEITSEANLRGLLYKIAYNKCLETLRVKSGKYRMFYHVESDENNSSEDYADSLIIKAELLRVITEKYESLPPARKKVFDLIYLHSFDVKTIAAIMNTEENTIAQHKRKILKEFRFLGASLIPKNYWIKRGNGFLLSKKIKK